jgi:hypothetical protein
MTSLESKAVNAILGRIRARRSDATGNGSSPVHVKRDFSPAKLREAKLSDYEAITDIKRRGGIVVDPIENWERLWVQNPALEYVKGLPMGWVLEAQDKVVGYLGSIPLLYRSGCKRLTAVAGTGFVVDPEYRSSSLTLDSAFYRQKPVDLHLATTAIEAVGKLAIAFKSAPLPQPDFDAVLFWILRPYPFAQALMKKLDLMPPLPGIGSVLASMAIQSDRLFRRRGPSQCVTSLDVTESPVSEIGEEFDALWTGKTSESPRLYADRSAATLRWHFQIPGHQGTTHVLSCRNKGTLIGYAVVRNDPERPDGLKRSLLADLLAKGDDAEIVRALFLAAFELARRSNSHVLEVIGLPPSVRQVISESNPYVHKLPSCPFYYRANDPALHHALSDYRAWYVTAYDGDRTIMP